MIHVALLDDHPAVRAGVTAILEPQGDVQLVGSAGDEQELWPLLDHTDPDVAILDLHHPGRNGLTLCPELKRRSHPPGVLLYSATTPAALVVAAAVAGTDAIIGSTADDLEWRAPTPAGVAARRPPGG
jgi:two-component system response regulator DevR